MIKLVESTGFTKKEAQVYVALLELGRGDVSDIARISGLKRSIIYVLLEGLIKRAYASQVPDAKVNTYQAADPSIIFAKLKTTTKNFGEMLPFLQTLHNKGGKRPKITYYENAESIWKIYEFINQYPEAFFISSYERIDKHFPGAINKWIKDYKKKLIPVQGRHLVPDNNFEIDIVKKLSAIGQEVRFLPGITNFNMDFSIYGNKLAITSLEDEPFIVVIESEELVKSMKLIFEIAWASGKQVNQ